MMDWTPEDENNAMKYGACPECRTPRERHIARETQPDGRVIVVIGLVAPCGHGIDPADPYAILPKQVSSE